MFEGFSFPSPPKGDSGAPLTTGYNTGMLIDFDSNLISPLCSRSPSPVSFCHRDSKDHPLLCTHSRPPFKLPPPPTSIPDNYNTCHRLSIGTLTKRLDAQRLDNGASSENDEGQSFSITSPHSASVHANMPSIWLENKPLSPPDVDRVDTSSCAEPSPTSTLMYIESRSPSASEANNLPYRPSHNTPINPLEHENEQEQEHEQYCSLRQHRENLSLLQCSTKTVAETVRIALLLEEAGRTCSSKNELNDDQHPSSLPSPPPSRKRSSFNSDNYHNHKPLNRSATELVSKSRLSPSPPSHGSKVEKSRHSLRNSNYNGGFRSGAKSPQGLRRRSLVLAAVIAMVEAEVAE
ncbi:hypothetical protein PAAG_04968 [Paracoccidioides lutzii Pb01]|uniref:Uncharacterized protein n=1 Tax=Paracoccidioides lutzii (strain ATCC MYA-826 / Pb01) TaxID=502779 RepID=C1H2H5_PARBA|nr:hypothetical protein PAAG_04968 [Paracoccidioides lutzii Pb01]EEH33919.1 hypothetical protein PAAG_04968 [Paracoccidioides lutzii Pb01]